MSESHFDLSMVPIKISDSIVVIDENHTVSFANEAASAFFNSNCNNIMGQKCYQIAFNSPFPCHKKDSSFDCLYDEVIRTEKASSATHTFSFCNDTQKTYETSATSINSRTEKYFRSLK